MSWFTPQLGIDLGTANTLVFSPGKGVVVAEPTVVALDERDRSIMAIGTEAYKMVGRTPDTIIAFHPMRDGVIADFKVTQAMLRHHYKKALSNTNIFKPEVVVSVPAGVSSTESRAVIEAAHAAGAKRAYIVKEPILAAVGAGIPIHEPQGYMIVDIGGGTTDVAVISLGSIVASHSVKCGGNALDKAIIDYVKKQHNLSVGKGTAEKIKIKIGAALHTQDELFLVIKGRDFVTGMPRSVTLSTNMVVDALRDQLNTMMQAIQHVLRQTPPELASDIIDNGILLTGGSAQLRNLDSLVQKFTGVRAFIAEDPALCVAKGTGIVLQHLDVYKRALMTKSRR